MIISGSIVEHLQIHEIKLRDFFEGILGLAVRVPYESKKESQFRVEMCDNALINELSIVLLSVTLP